MAVTLGGATGINLEKMEQDGLEVRQRQIIKAIENDDIPLLEEVLVRMGYDNHDSGAQIRELVLDIDPSYAAKLFHKLWHIFISDRPLAAPDSSNRDSRKNSPLRQNPKLLVEWIKWVLVAHGNSREISELIVSSYSEVSSLLKGRIEKMPKILALQGRLDMLRTQIKLRENNNNDITDDEDEVLPDDDDDMSSDDGSMVSSSSLSSSDEEAEEDGMADGVPELWKNLRQGKRETTSEDEIDQDIPIEDVSHIGGGDFLDEEDDEEEDLRI